MIERSIIRMTRWVANANPCDWRVASVVAAFFIFCAHSYGMFFCSLPEVSTEDMQRLQLEILPEIANATSISLLRPLSVSESLFQDAYEIRIEFSGGRPAIDAVLKVAGGFLARADLQRANMKMDGTKYVNDQIARLSTGLIPTRFSVSTNAQGEWRAKSDPTGKFKIHVVHPLTPILSWNDAPGADGKTIERLFYVQEKAEGTPLSEFHDGKNTTIFNSILAALDQFRSEIFKQGFSDNDYRLHNWLVAGPDAGGNITIYYFDFSLFEKMTPPARLLHGSK